MIPCRPLIAAVALAAALSQPLSSARSSGVQAAPDAAPGRITYLYDAFGPASALERDWGFAALVEYDGRRILFDAGNDAGIFAKNVAALGVDLSRLDAAILSHRHGDHTTGLSHLLSVNPEVPVYTPREPAAFRSEIPGSFLEREPGLPRELQYYDGRPPTRRLAGTPWPRARFATVTAAQEIAPGFYLLTTQSEKPGTREMNEVSLAIRTPRGLVVMVGCAHPGIERIVAEAAKIEPRIRLVTGGFHLVGAPQAEVDRVASALDQTLRVERVAPGHCTSERGFAALLRRFGDRFDRAGVGVVLELR